MPTKNFLKLKKTYETLIQIFFDSIGLTINLYSLTITSLKPLLFRTNFKQNWITFYLITLKQRSLSQKLKYLKYLPPSVKCKKSYQKI